MKFLIYLSLGIITIFAYWIIMITISFIFKKKLINIINTADRGSTLFFDKETKETSRKLEKEKADKDFRIIYNYIHVIATILATVFVFLMYKKHCNIKTITIPKKKEYQMAKRRRRKDRRYFRNNNEPTTKRGRKNRKK